MWTKAFWFQSAERAIKTAAQTAAGLISANGLGVLDVDWSQMGSVTALALLYSLLTSVGGVNLGAKKGSPDLV